MTTSEAPLGTAPKPGQALHLVRWIRSADGWTSETVLCTYLGCTPEEWLVETNGEEAALPRSEWAQFAF